MKNEEILRRAELAKQTWFKVLRTGTFSGKPTLYSRSGGTKQWQAPRPNRAAPWQTEPNVSICHRGLHITTDPWQWSAEASDAKVFTVEVPWFDPAVKISDQSGDKIAVSKMRLLRESTPNDYAEAGIIVTDTTMQHFKFRDITVRSGRLSCYSCEHSQFAVYEGASFNLMGQSSHVFAYRNAADSRMEDGSVRWSSSNTLTLVDGYAEVAAGGKVHAKGNSVVRLQNPNALVYAEDRSVVIVESHNCTIVTPPSASVTIQYGSFNVQSSHPEFAIELDENGNFVRFLKRPAGLSDGHKLIT